MADQSPSGGVPSTSLLRRALLDDPKHGWLPVLLLVMTLLSGVVDAVSILSLGRVFVANMTGNMVFSGFALSGASGFSVTRSLLSLLAFAVGVAACRAMEATWAMNRIVVLRNGAAFEVALLGTATAVSVAVGPHLAAGTQDALVCMLAAALGMQNGLVLRLAVPELTTTVVTRTLVGLISRWGTQGSGPASVRQLLGIFALVVGGVTGGLLVRLVDPQSALGLAATLAALTAVVAAVAARKGASWH